MATTDAILVGLLVLAFWLDVWEGRWAILIWWRSRGVRIAGYTMMTRHQVQVCLVQVVRGLGLATMMAALLMPNWGEWPGRFFLVEWSINVVILMQVLHSVTAWWVRMRFMDEQFWRGTDGSVG